MKQVNLSQFDEHIRKFKGEVMMIPNALYNGRLETYYSKFELIGKLTITTMEVKAAVDYPQVKGYEKKESKTVTRYYIKEWY